jgi:hypothetical protein
MLLILIILIILYNTNSIENYNNLSDLSSDNVPNLQGNWIIPSLIPNKNRTLELKQKGNNVTGNDDNCLGNGIGTIVSNKIIWKWGNNDNTKMIGDIILGDLDDINKATKIKWQNGYSWYQILPAFDISGNWIGDGLQYGPINIRQNNNSIIATYPLYGGFRGNVFNKKIKIYWFNNVTVNGDISKDSSNNDIIIWDSGNKWTRHLNQNNNKKLSNKKNISQKLPTSLQPEEPIKIPPPPLQLPKKNKKLVNQYFSSPLPPVIGENIPYPVLTN